MPLIRTVCFLQRLVIVNVIATPQNAGEAIPTLSRHYEERSDEVISLKNMQLLNIQMRFNGYG